MKIPPSIIHAGGITLDKTLFKIGSPEFWHNMSMKKIDSFEKIDWILDTLGESLYLEDDFLKIEVGNMKMKNPIGISAGLVKQPHGLKFLEALGVGFITIGGITKEAQPGNEPQRIFKFNKDIINGMGLPGDGRGKVFEMLEKRKKLGMMPGVPLIANLCNSAVNSSDEENIEEFLFLMEKLYLYVDGFEINVSCPNQCGITSNQREDKLKNILQRVMKKNEELAIQNGCKKKSILVKIAPLTKEDNPDKIQDLTSEELELIIGVCNEVGVDGITATNTSKEHDYSTNIIMPDGGIIKGGLSGLGLHEESLKTVKFIKERLDGHISIIGTGGIGYDNGASGVNMINAGATGIGILSSLTQRSIAVPHYLKKAIIEGKNS